MKKLLSVLLCIVFVCFTFVGCAEDVIGEYLDNYNTGAVSDDKIEKLNFYIITGDGTSNEAKITVPQNINTYLKEKYEIELNIKYYTADEYDTAVYQALENQTEADRPDIVLINSEAMFDTLYAGNNLVKLNDFYNSRDFRSINTIVDDVLLSASAIVDSESGASTYYTVPNNHIIDKYEYIVIDKAMARDTLHFSNAKIEAMTTEVALAELKNAIGDYYDDNESGSSLTKDEFIAKHVRVVSGDNTMKELLEYGVETSDEITKDSIKKNFVNVSAYPNATENEAFLSAFAIIKNLTDTGVYTEEEEAILYNHYSKCMKIIYALNTDIQLKNMLQYGYVGTNYRFIKNEKNENTNYIQLIKNAEVIYEMNPIYTGNLFISYYCEEIGWNEEIHNTILKQNGDAKTPEQKINYEIGNLNVNDTVLSTEILSLPTYGSLYSDVNIVWTSESELVNISSDGTVSFTTPSEETSVSITATLSCPYAAEGKTVTFTVKISV